MFTQHFQILLCINLLTISHRCSVYCNISENEYQEKSICEVQARIDNGCLIITQARSRLGCFTLCSPRSSCLGVLVPASGSTPCYHQVACAYMPSICTAMDTAYRFYRKGSQIASTESPETTEVTTISPETTKITTQSPETTEVPTISPETTKITTQSPETTEVTTISPETTKITTQSPETTEVTTISSETTKITTQSSETTKVTTEFPETTTAANCLNGGTEPTPGVCDCTGTSGYVGTRCATLATTCEELYNDGYPQGAFPLTIDLFKDGTVKYYTHCRLRTWMSTMKSFDIMMSTGSFDTTLSWNEYVTGFYLGPQDYWIGLENLHKFTSDGSRHKVRTAVHYNSSIATGVYAKSHIDFVVGDASVNYAYTINSLGYYSDMLQISQGDPTKYHISDYFVQLANTPFSTPDRDQDNSANKHCAEIAQAGWWFKRCNPFVANPFGWSYSAKPALSPSDEYFSMLGIDMSDANVREAFDFVYITLDL